MGPRDIPVSLRKRCRRRPVGLRGALGVYPDPPVSGHLDPVLTSFCSLDSGVTPAPLVSPSWSHVAKTVQTHLLVTLPGPVPAVDPEPLLEKPAASPEQEAWPPPAAAWRPARSLWCSALPPPHGPALGSGTLAVCVGGRAGARPARGGRLGSLTGLASAGSGRGGHTHPVFARGGVGGVFGL